MDRRKFIQTGLGAVGGLMLPWQKALSQAGEAVAGGKTRVWMAEGDPFKAAGLLAEAIGGMHKFIPADGVVLVKPNIVFATPPEWGGTTHPDFVAAICDLCIDGGAKKVIVADHMVGSEPQKNLDKTGIGKACEGKEKVEIVMIQDKVAYRPLTVEKGISLKETMTAKLLDEVDLFINVPTAKHSTAAGISMGIKNLMGVIWDRDPFHNDLDLQQAVADLGSAVAADLTFLDNRYAMISGGPKGPCEAVEMNQYMVGFDPLAVDAIGAGLAPWGNMERKAADIPHLVKAYELGVGEIEDIEVVEVG
jgi:uncharacterized protein (DUF362 family)